MRFTRSARFALVAFICASVCAAPLHADELRVVTWNITNYSSGRVSQIQSSVYGVFEGRSLAPDVILGQEFLSQTGVNNFLAIINSAPGSPSDWAAAAFINGADTDNAFFYRTSKVALATELSANGMTVVSTGSPSPNHPRDINRYDIRLVNETSDSTRIALYSSHMKAGSGSSDQARRLVEAIEIRDDAESLPAGWHFILGGDFNIQTWTQSAYQEMTGSQANNDGRFFDPIKTPGSWNNNSSFRFVHTQDPSGAGGMDDRHDQVLISGSLLDGTGPDYIGDSNIAYSNSTWDDPNHSYRSWGNDGTSFNVSLKIAGNTMVGSTIATALVGAALNGGHLPVFLNLRVAPCAGDFDCDGDIDLDDAAAFVDCLEGPNVLPDPTPPALTDDCLDTFDADIDDDIDLVDFSVFQIEFTGS